MRATIAALLACLCVAGASIAKGDDGFAPAPAPTSEMIVAAVAAAEKAAHLSEDTGRCAPALPRAQRS